MKANLLSKRHRNRKPPGENLDFKLYVIDRTLKSVAAFTNLMKICHDNLDDRCHIEVIDIEKTPRLAKENEIVAIPTLVKTFPLPARRGIGDLSNTGRVLSGLDLHPAIKGATQITHPIDRRHNPHA